MSDIIRLLPDAIANQIAAGEVVQRPASVVKELLENAIDAGASQVQVLVREAGKNCIQVIDNGKGMSETDARMSFERHATSKISTSDDLFSIRTKGFRGEALASIAAVAQVEMRTRTAENELGTKICIEGSEVKLQEPEATPEGTFIAVKNLFFNVPARRNFLKSNAVEMRHILDEFIRVALAHPDVAFSLHQNDLETFQLTPGKLSQRIVQLFGKNYKEQLAACQEETPHVRISGYIGKPEAAKKTRGEQFFFLNNRYIRNNYLNHAIMQAYEGLLQSDTYPFYVLFLEMDPKDIDINVHPTKTEVKFADERTVYAIVHSAVRQAIGTHNLTPSLNFDQDVNFTNFLSGGSRPESQQESPKASPQQQDRSWSQFGSSHPREDANLKNWQRLFDAPEAPRQDPLPFPEQEQPKTVIQPSRAFGEAVTFESAANQLPGESKQPGLIAEGELNAFQLHQRYIVSQVKSGMILFDQAATHERILYEKFLQQLRQRSGSSQQFLFPQQLQLNPQDFALVNDLMDEIQALGFDVEPFGQQTLKINGLPADLSGQDAGMLFEGLIEQFKQYRSELSLGTHEGMARALAVRSGIRAGQQLSSLEMRTLIDQLFACENPNHAPDGRRTFVVLDLEKIASFFI